MKIAPLVLALGACEPSLGPAPPEAPATAPKPAKSTRRAAEDRAEEGVRLRSGDFVSYRYTGTFSEHPVVVSQRVIDGNGERLVIEVTIEHGSERRSFEKVVASRDLTELSSLHEWASPPCSGDAQSAGTVELEMPVAGARLPCRCDKVLRECAGKPAQVETCQCQGFSWGPASGIANAPDGATPIWKMEVTRFGNAR